MQKRAMQVRSDRPQKRLLVEGPDDAHAEQFVAWIRQLFNLL